MELELRTERLVIRPYSRDFLEEYYKGFTEEITKYQYPDHFPDIGTADEVVSGFVQEMERGEMLELVVLAEDGSFLGSMEAFGIREETPEIGLWLKSSAHGKGYGYEALKGLLDHLSGYRKYQYYIYEADVRNLPSIRLVERFQFEKGGYEDITTESGKKLSLQTYHIFHSGKGERSNSPENREGVVEMVDITAVGEVLIDLTQSGVNEQGIPRFDANPGGAPANLAVAAARLGASTAFIGKVGRDSFGDFLRSCLAENGVDVSGMAIDPVQHTTLAVVAVDPSGERNFSFYRDPSADVDLTAEEISEEQLKNTRFLHFGSVSLTAEPARSATLYAAKRARELGALVSYDPNYRASLWPDEATAVARMRESLPLADVLKVSDEELPLLTGTEDLEQGTAQLAEQGIALILVTLGPKGAFYRFRGQTGLVPGVPCKVGDTNGAGDTFFGAALSQLAKLGGLDELTIPELERIVALANKAASITTSRHGAIPAMPTLEEVLA